MDEPTPAAPGTLEDVREEGERLAGAAAGQQVPLRLLGGVAFWVRCPSARLPGLSRTYGDVDLIGLSAERHRITEFCEQMGYQADRMFNALHGAQRLNFMDPVRDRPLDVILDQFAMCHSIDLRGRLDAEPLTIPLAELVLTKLQVVELNDKDLRDLIAVFADHDVEGSPPDSIDLGRVASLLGADWGFEHTVRLNLGRLGDAVDDYEIPPDMRATVRARVAKTVEALDRGKKTMGWKARSWVGERVRWYELPEEVRH